MAEEKYRKAKRSTSTIARMRRVVFPRDDWTCQDCGYQMPPTTDDHLSGRYAPYDGDNFLELDHITPEIAGGLYVANNLRALCSSCNRKKSVSMLYADWPARIARATDLLQSGPANQLT